MAAVEQGMNRGSSEPSGRNKNGRDDSVPRVRNVDFDEMNFEQRRAPYNSGSRTLTDKIYDRAHKRNEGPGNERDRD